MRSKLNGPNYLKVVEYIEKHPSRDASDLKYKNHLRGAEAAGLIEYRTGRGWNLTADGKARLERARTGA